jgi:hypothetical protein
MLFYGLSALILLFPIYIGSANEILYVIDVIAMGAIAARIVAHFTYYKSQVNLLKCAKLPFLLVLQTIVVFWLIQTFLDPVDMTVAAIVTTIDNFFDIFLCMITYRFSLR